jgi:hypothetical protein
MLKFYEKFFLLGNMIDNFRVNYLRVMKNGVGEWLVEVKAVL